MSSMKEEKIFNVLLSNSQVALGRDSQQPRSEAFSPSNEQAPAFRLQIPLVSCSLLGFHSQDEGGGGEWEGDYIQCTQIYMEGRWGQVIFRWNHTFKCYPSRRVRFVCSWVWVFVVLFLVHRPCMNHVTPRLMLCRGLHTDEDGCGQDEKGVFKVNSW